MQRIILIIWISLFPLSALAYTSGAIGEKLGKETGTQVVSTANISGAVDFETEKEVGAHAASSLFVIGRLLNIQGGTYTRSVINSVNPVGYGAIGYSIPVSSTVYVFVVQLNDLAYLLQYEAKWRWSYLPQWTVGDPIELRFNKKGTDAYLKRPDGKELKTKIVQKVRIELKLGEMIKGKLIDLKTGNTFPMEIEKVLGSSGKMNVKNPANNELFEGTYVGFRNGTSIVPAEATLRSNKKTVLICKFTIQAGMSPHGSGQCSDKKGNEYSLNF